jgi:YfiH family protein
MWLSSSRLSRLGIVHGFSVAAQGDFRLVPRPRGVAVARQVHGSSWAWATLASESVAEADALLATRGMGVGVFTADCVPILLYDPRASEPVAAAVHAGWRGTLAGVVPSAVSALIAAGAQPGSLAVAIGPAIRRCCYEVSRELAQTFASRFGPDVVHADRHLDLIATVVQQLTGQGIPAASIDDLGQCTHCAHDLAGPRFFSHRRQGTEAGRHLSWIAP